MNKNIPTIILAIAVVVLYILHFSQDKTVQQPVQSVATVTSDTSAVSSQDFPMAYVNLDSLLFSYELYNQLKKEQEKKYKASEARFQKQAQAFQQDFMKAQNDAQKGLMTRAEAQAKEQEFATREQELMQLEQSLTQDLAQKEEQMQQRIYDSIKVVLEDFNADNKYRVILNNAFGSAILDADENLNITDTIITILNEKQNL